MPLTLSSQRLFDIVGVLASAIRKFDFPNLIAGEIQDLKIPEPASDFNLDTRRIFVLYVDNASVDRFENFSAENRFVARCILDSPTMIEGHVSGCSVLPGSTIDARSVSLSSIQVSDLKRLPQFGLWMTSSLATITPHPDGGGYLLWTSRIGRAILTRIDASGNAADVGGVFKRLLNPPA
jgi:hypothetical protein